MVHGKAWVLGYRRIRSTKTINPNNCSSTTEHRLHWGPQGENHSAARKQCSILALCSGVLIQWLWNNFRQSAGNAIQMFKKVSNMRIIKLSTSQLNGDSVKFKRWGPTETDFTGHSIFWYFSTESFTVLSFNWKHLTYYKLSWIAPSWTPPKCSFQIYEPLQGPAGTGTQSRGFRWKTDNNLQRTCLM